MSDNTRLPNLLGMDRQALKAFFSNIGEKPFRVDQVMRWLYRDQVTEFEQMTNLSKALRQKLSRCAVIEMPEVAFKEFSADGTRKWVLALDSGNRIETVFIPEGHRGTLCVSSQVGCALDCSFCSTGKQGFHRDLTAAEIIAQVWIATASFGIPENKGRRPITNIVMMGMGEPLLNFDAVTQAMSLMLDDLGYGISKRRLTLSTSGIVPAIDRLSEVLDVSLAISLHAPNNELRNELVPINRKYPLSELVAACDRFIKKYPDKRMITIEYVMLDGVNDHIKHAKELAALLDTLPCKINLIPFNPFPHAPYRRSSSNRTSRFQKILQDAGFVTTIRTTRGDDIDAACGQLVGLVEDRTSRSQAWQAVKFKSQTNEAQT